MGIPKFAKFIITRYPLVIQRLKDNPTIIDLDYLYLDLNGIIHIMSHNNSFEQMLSNRSYNDIYYDVFKYIDQIIHLVRPNKFLMIAADGVAPRAKMNQQRTRRFKKTNLDSDQLAMLQKQGKEYKDLFNSDCISPGTEFMQGLNDAFDLYISMKISEDPLWKNLKVVLSSADVPGEGEHKIVDYIRQYKASNEYNHDDTHCIYGLDADLIMLGLITHIPNLFILREETQIKKKKPGTVFRSSIKITDNFELLHISLLREYLELEFSEVKDKIRFEYNSERIIDDFLFICFFIGNDFLPSLNTLDIEEGSLDKIFEIYKNVLPKLDDYITFHGEIDFKKAEVVFKSLSTLELDSLRSMLKKLEMKVEERKEKREKLLLNKKADSNKVKLAKKKIKKIGELKRELSKTEQKTVKKKYVNKKISKLKESYEKEVERSGLGSRVFEEDVRKTKNNEPIFGVFDTNQIGLIGNKSSFNFKNTNNAYLTNGEESSSTLNKITDATRNYVACFGSSDDEGKEGKERKEKTKIKQISVEEQEENKKNIFSILKNSLKYYKYINDRDNEAIYSDINPNDLNDSDVSQIVDDEENIENEINYNDGFNNQLIECQDYEKVFQQRLVELYINDIHEAKKFYYSEKVKINMNSPDASYTQKNMFRKYLEGLQWVLYYYYRGIQSWTWYYPYHYPPMISDFSNMEELLSCNINLSFSNINDSPVLPFQSLTMILPESSKNLLPPAYHSIYKDYPENYPTKFIIDFNGKRLPWEALVILPFVDQEKLIKIEESIRNKFSIENIDNLSENEKTLVLSKEVLERNKRGNTWIYKYSNDSVYYTKIKNFKFIDVTNNFFRVSKEVIIIKNDDVNSCLEYNYKRKEVSFKSPTLSTIKFQFYFNRISNYRNKRDGPPPKKLKVLTINPTSKFSGKSDEEMDEIIKSAMKNSEINVNYPYKTEGKIVGIAYMNKYYYKKDNGAIVSENYKITNELRSTCKSELFKTGIYLEEITSNFFIEIVPFDRYVKSQNGNLVKLYNENERYFTPVEMTSLNCINDYTYRNVLMNSMEKYSKYRIVSSEFRKEVNCLLLTNTNYGSLVQVESVISKNSSEYNKYNEMNYEQKYYDSKVNYDLSSNDWKLNLNKLYSGDLVSTVTMNNSNFNNKKYSSSYPYTPFEYIDSIPTKAIYSILKKTNEYYISMDELGKSLNISNWTLSILSSCVYIIDANENDDEEEFISEGKYWNLGLNMKSNKNGKLVLPGYTRYYSGNRNSTNWEFSSEACSLIETYKKKYPIIFNALEQYDQSNLTRYFKVSDLFKKGINLNPHLNTNKDGQIGNENNFDLSLLDEISNWISSQGLGDLGFATQNSNFLSKKDIAKIIDLVDSKNVLTLTNTPGKLSTEKYVVNPNYLISDNVPYVERFGYKKLFRIGDRVTNVRSDDKRYIPFGMKGVVTGVCEGFYEVLFDYPFIGGETCGGRLPIGRGGYVYPENLLNLSYKEPVFLRRNKENFEPVNYKEEEERRQDYYSYPSVQEKKKYKEYDEYGYVVNDEKVEKKENDDVNKNKSNRYYSFNDNTKGYKSNNNQKNSNFKQKSNVNNGNQSNNTQVNPQNNKKKINLISNEKKNEKIINPDDLFKDDCLITEINTCLNDGKEKEKDIVFKKHDVYFFGKEEVKTKLQMFNSNII